MTSLIAPSNTYMPEDAERQRVTMEQLALLNVAQRSPKSSKSDDKENKKKESNEDEKKDKKNKENNKEDR